MKNITLREITEDTLSPILKLNVSHEQRKFVADNATSIAQTEGSPERFYKKLGFKLTGEYDDGEAIMKLKL